MCRLGYLGILALILSGCTTGQPSNEPDKAATDQWFTATGEEDGFPLIFRARQDVPVGASQSDYPNQILVEWHFDVDDNNGMPPQATNEAQVEFEDALAILDDGSTSYLMLVVTGNGRKFWYWYAKDVPEWMDQLNGLLAEHPVYPIEISDTSDPEWSVWRGLLSNTEGL